MSQRYLKRLTQGDRGYSTKGKLYSYTLNNDGVTFNYVNDSGVSRNIWVGHIGTSWKEAIKENLIGGKLL